MMVDALDDGMQTMRSNHSDMNAIFGDVFRVGRDELSWPVGGGSQTPEGMATLRSANFNEERPDHTRWGYGGQTSTEVVVLSKPIGASRSLQSGRVIAKTLPTIGTRQRNFSAKLR